MCGRINVSDHAGVQELLDFLEIPLFPSSLPPRFNIAPGATLPTIVNNEGRLECNPMSWGIVPRWAKPDTFSRPLINARAETIWEKPSFKSLVKSFRAIIPINGFYEWQRQNKLKVPYYISASNSNVLALGGIFNISNDGELQCCIITTEANTKMEKVHNRMPVIITRDNIKEWLATENKNTLNNYMQPILDDLINIQQVTPYVNNAKNDGEKCIEVV